MERSLKFKGNLSGRTTFGFDHGCTVYDKEDKSDCSVEEENRIRVTIVIVDDYGSEDEAN